MQRRLTLLIVVVSIVVVSACSGADTGPVYFADEVTATAPPASPAPPVVPLTTVSTGGTAVSGTTLPDTTMPADRTIVFDRLYSPENAVAEIIGSGAVATDIATVDDTPTTYTSFETSPDGGFTARIAVADQGAHTVCIAATCGRVYTLDADAETPEEIEAKIVEAEAAALVHFDFEGAFPDWTLDVSGPFSGIGGTTDDETKTVTIYSNRDRTVDDFTRTFLHEWGHVLDSERLTDAERADYLILRGIPADTPWRGGVAADDHSIEAWALQPSEDFAEVMAMVLSDGGYTPRTSTLAALPTDEVLRAAATLVEL